MDLNADGFNDILSGSYSRQEQPMAGTFQVLWGKADGTFKKAATLNGTDDKPLVIPNKGENDIIESICTRPTAVDWDGDGDLDLVVGNFAGTFVLFTGEGGGKFKPGSTPIMAGSERLKLLGKRPKPDQPAGTGHHSDPFFVDWDKDGDLDLFSGAADGGVQWAENTAGAKKPIVLKPFTQLFDPPADGYAEYRPDEVAGPSGSTRVWIADVNSDGKLDVLVGDSVNLVSPAKGLSEADFVKRREEWKKAFAAVQAEMATVMPDVQAADGEAGQDAEKAQKQIDEQMKKMEAAQERMGKLYEQRNEFMTFDRTGFVWVYMQK